MIFALRDSTLPRAEVLLSVPCFVQGSCFFCSIPGVCQVLRADGDPLRLRGNLVITIRYSLSQSRCLLAVSVPCLAPLCSR